MSENTPVYGCDGCNTTGGRMSCPIHGATRVWAGGLPWPNGTSWLGDSFGEIGRLQAEIERLQGLLAANDREFNAENLRAERAEASAKAWEEDALLRAKNKAFWLERAERAEARVKELEGIILRTSLWHYAPCCICGYKGPGYFQPETHKCARGGEE